MKAELPSQRYEAVLAKNGYESDPAQKAAITALDEVWVALSNQSAPGLLTQLKNHLGLGGLQRHPVKGLYLWGGVGRGKTFLMDIFFHALPFDDKLRLHFHRFMRQVHDDLKSLKKEPDPLVVVAARFSKKARVICFDEFFVSDITDAMILGRLLEHLFSFGVTLVATSNISPDELYKDGLQRVHFLPAIHVIRENCKALNIDAGVDYRLRTLELAEIYRWPLGKVAEESMEKYFLRLNPDEGWRENSLSINGRKIKTRRIGDGVVWFDFEDLCGGPRSSGDYIEIALEFQSVLISNIPIMDWARENEARRFVAMIDEFYDRRVKIVISAEAPIDRLYKGSLLTLEFGRTQSRIIEMQSHSYIHGMHLG